MDEFTIDSRGSTFLLYGELDVETAPILRSATVAAVTCGGPLTLDFSSVTFMDASGLHEIIKIASDMPSGCVYVHGVREIVRRVFEICDLDAMKNVHVTPCDVLV